MEGEFDDGHLDQVDEQRVHERQLEQVDNPDDEEMDIEDQNHFQIRVAKNILIPTSPQIIISNVHSIEERPIERQNLSQEAGSSVTNYQDHDDIIVYYPEHKGDTFLINLNNKRGNRGLNSTDFQIKLEGGDIVHAHKVLLENFNFFQYIIQNTNQSMIEFNNKDVPHCTNGIFEDVVSYMYGCPTRITGENIFGLLNLSCYLGLNELYEQCNQNFTKVWTRAESQLKIENWKKFFQTAIQLQLDAGQELVELILDFIAKSGLLHDFVISEEFLTLNKDQFYSILMSEKSPFKDDESAYFAIIDWNSKTFDDLAESKIRRNETVELIKIVNNRSIQNSMDNLTTQVVNNQQMVLPRPVSPTSSSQDGNIETTAHLLENGPLFDLFENGPSTPANTPKKRGRPPKIKREHVSSTSPKPSNKRGRTCKSLPPVNVANDEQIELPSSTSSSRSTFHRSTRAKSQNNSAFLDQFKNCPSTSTSSHYYKERPAVNDSFKLEQDIKAEYDLDDDGGGLFDDYSSLFFVKSDESEIEEDEIREEPRMEISDKIVTENLSYLQANKAIIVHHFLENKFESSPILCFMGTLKRRPCMIAYSILDSTSQIVTGLPRNFLSSGHSELVCSKEKLYSLGWRDASSKETFRNVESIKLSYLKRFISSNKTKKASNLWQIEPKTLKRRSFCPALITDKYLYIVGGHGQNFHKGGKDYFPLDTAETYDIKTKVRNEIPSMGEKRSEVCVVELQGKVYALGGIKNSTTNGKSNTVEAYDPETRKWTFVQKMNHKRSNGSAFVIDDWIYMIGGNLGVEPSMERYNPEQDHWSLIDSPNLPKGANYSSCALLKI